MNVMNRIWALIAGSTAMIFLLGTSVALAQEVCLEGDTVVAIKGLTIPTVQYGTIDVDVDFRYSDLYSVYGSNLDFPFFGGNVEEDAFVAMTSINDALDVDVPKYAGQPNEDVYFIGVEKDDSSAEEVVAVVGSENLDGRWWDPCTRANDCVLGTDIQNPTVRKTYADFSHATGAPCGGSGPDLPDPPDPPAFTITPGISGVWYDPARNGEGYSIEINGSSLAPTMVAYYYTYDDEGNQMWLLAQGSVIGDTATLTAWVTSGPVFGPDYDFDDYEQVEWGTITLVFTSCTTGTATYESTIGFGSGTTVLNRLSYITGLACP